MNELPPAAQGEQRPNHNFRKSEFIYPQTSKHPQLPIEKNHLFILEDIANSRPSFGYFPSSSVAMETLTEGYHANV